MKYKGKQVSKQGEEAVYDILPLFQGQLLTFLIITLEENDIIFITYPINRSPVAKYSDGLMFI